MARFQLRRGTTAQWTTANPVLAKGEPGWNETTGEFKIGDGVQTWTDLPTVTGEGGGSGGSVSWGDVASKPAVIAAGATQAEARSAIGAGTSNLSIGASASQAVAGNDTRLSNQRVPTDGSVTPAKINATGTPSVGTFLRGDGTWSPVAGGGGSEFSRVIVSAGLEARPSVDFVLWMGGDERPVNMIDGDLWMQPVAAPDITPPSVPTGLASSAITTAGFTLTWAASTGSPVGYEVRVNAGTAIAVSGLSHAFTGLSANTLHAAQVRARDAAGNWSAWSTALNVTTLVSSDTTAPTVPSGLASSAITTTGFTVTWTASTDTVGVTGYELFIGGVSYGTSVGNSLAVTGRTPGTAHSVTVRARDAAGNWSAQSSALVVNTLAASTAEHTIFGSAVPGTPALLSDGTPSIRLGQKFYTYGVATGPGNLPTAKCIGGRVYLPAGHGMTAMKVLGWQNVGTGMGGSPGHLGATPLREVSVNITGLSGWVEARWTAFDMTEGQFALIAYEFTNNIANYVSCVAARPDEGFLRALDNSKLVWGEHPEPTAGTLFRIGTNPTAQPAGGSNSYGIDIIVAES